MFVLENVIEVSFRDFFEVTALAKSSSMGSEVESAGSDVEESVPRLDSKGGGSGLDSEVVGARSDEKAVTTAPLAAWVPVTATTLRSAPPSSTPRVRRVATW